MNQPDIPGVVLETLEDHRDERGAFTELIRLGTYPQKFAQVNHSHSKAGVLRGLHYHQHQADLWYVPRGRIQVGLVDLRPGQGVPASGTLYMDGHHPARLFIPRGVAHGFLALEESDLLYLVTHAYDASDEHGLAWNDRTAGLAWDLGNNDPVLSERDRNNPNLVWELIPSF